MRHVNAVLAILATVAGIAVANPASAQFQLGVQVGRAKAEGLCDGVPGAFNCSEVDNTVPRGFVGYQFTRNWGVEVGAAGGKAGASGTQTITAHVYDAVLVGTLPISSSFDVYGKAGFYHARIKETDRVVGGVVIANGRSSRNSDFTVGGGVQYNATKNIALRAELSVYQDVGSGSITTTRDISAVSVAALWRFQ